MHYFADISATDLVPILTIFGTMLAGFFAIARLMIKQASSERDADRTERVNISENLGNAIERMASSNERIAKEAEERNGHLAEISIQNKDAILNAIDNVSLNQDIKEQSVQHQTINSKE